MCPAVVRGPWFAQSTLAWAWAAARPRLPAPLRVGMVQVVQGVHESDLGDLRKRVVREERLVALQTQRHRVLET